MLATRAMHSKRGDQNPQIEEKTDDDGLAASASGSLIGLVLPESDH